MKSRQLSLPGVSWENTEAEWEGGPVRGEGQGKVKPESHVAATQSLAAHLTRRGHAAWVPGWGTLLPRVQECFALTVERFRDESLGHSERASRMSR